MTSISPVSHSAALAVLRQAWPPSGSALHFLSSSVFKASSASVANALAAAFTPNGELQKAFSSRYDVAMDSAAKEYSGGIHPDNARHIALVDTITANRESFPPEEFTVHTDLPDGASITTTIPSVAAMKGEIFKKWVQRREQTSFDASKAAKEARPDDAASGTAARRFCRKSSRQSCSTATKARP